MKKARGGSTECQPFRALLLKTGEHKVADLVNRAKISLEVRMGRKLERREMASTGIVDEYEKS